jgi:RTX calcium-binding nonapeptide repeat (4 copies)
MAGRTATLEAFSFRSLRRALLLGALALAIVGAGPLVSEASASHFRGSDVNWVEVGPNTADFTLHGAFARDGYPGSAPDGHPAVGDIINESIGGTAFFYGDSSGTPQLQYRVDSINVAENFLTGTALEPGSSTDTTLTHAYGSPGPFRAQIDSCCNIGDLNNNAGGSYSVGTDVDFATDDQSPITSVPPIVTVGNSGDQQFFVPASDPGGQNLRFRLATAAEACSGACTDPNPPDLSIDPNTGQVTFNTTGKSLGLYIASIVIEARSGGNLVSSTQTTFIIRVADPGANNPPVFVPPSPPDGEEFTVAPGAGTCFDLRATDADSGDTVELIPGALPENATFTNSSGNPATGRFLFQPTASQDGQDFIVNFTAQDNRTPPGSDFRSYTLRVRAGAPPAPQCVDEPATPAPSGECLAAAITINGRTFQGDDSNEAILGTPENDLLLGGGGNDAIDGIPGDDCLFGEGGDDALDGADGHDFLSGGAGADAGAGQAGSDTMRGEAGADAFAGGPGDDNIDGGTDADSLEGEEDNDRVIGRGSDDRIKGGPNRDRVQGSGGEDRVNGDEGKDTVRGGTKDDRVVGGNGKDKVQSQGGKDKVSGGNGRDNIRAGGGNDKVDAADGFPDKVKCGLGFDEAVVDIKDKVNDDCNEVTVKQGNK